MPRVLSLMRRHVLATLAFVIVLAGTAFAAGSGLQAGGKHRRARTIYACVERGSAELRMIGARAACPEGERKISWNRTGRRGARGLKGARGAAGAAGRAGGQGPEGQAGKEGKQGNAGAPGAPGLPGSEGPEGKIGPIGPIGPMGPIGAQGPEGPEGPMGPVGAQGGEGPEGPIGPEGPVGPQGPPGPEGKAPSLGYGYGYDTSVSGETVAGGADLTFSNNGPMSEVTHSAGTSTFTVSATGTYELTFGVSITAGVGAELAIAVNGTVDASTVIPVLTATGEVTGNSILTLVAGDVVTVRDNSAVAITTASAPSVGASLTIQRLS